MFCWLHQVIISNTKLLGRCFAIFRRITTLPILRLNLLVLSKPKCFRKRSKLFEIYDGGINFLLFQSFKGQIPEGSHQPSNKISVEFNSKYQINLQIESKINFIYYHFPLNFGTHLWNIFLRFRCTDWCHFGIKENWKKNTDKTILVLLFGKP